MAGRRMGGAAKKVECIAPEAETHEEEPQRQESQHQEPQEELSDSVLEERAGRILRQGLPSVATALLEGAGRGGITHIKLALDLIGIEKGAFTSKEERPKEKSEYKLMLERWLQEP